MASAKVKTGIAKIDEAQTTCAPHEFNAERTDPKQRVYALKCGACGLNTDRMAWTFGSGAPGHAKVGRMA
jgi:hypothetical protein